MNSLLTEYNLPLSRHSSQIQNSMAWPIYLKTQKYSSYFALSGKFSLNPVP